MNPLQSNLSARHQALSNLAPAHPETDMLQSGIAEQHSSPALPASIPVGRHTFHIGRVATALSRNETELLHAALHPETPKDLLSDAPNTHGFFTFAIGAKDYFASSHLPRHHPERMLVTFALDHLLRLERVLIRDTTSDHTYCDAHFEPPAAQTRQAAISERLSSPPKHSLLGIAVELQQAIMGHVLAGSTKRQGTYDLSALENTSRRLKFILEGNTLLKYKHGLQKKFIGFVNKLLISDLAFADLSLFALASHEKKEACLEMAIKYHDRKSICTLGRAIEALTPDQSTRLVDAILSPWIDHDDDINMEGGPFTKGSMIGSLGNGLHTIPDRHTEIIGHVTSLPESDKGWAIYNLSRGLQSFNAGFLEVLVRDTLNIEDEAFKSEAVGGLAEGMSTLTELQRDDVFAAALQFESEIEFSNTVLPGLCKGLHALTPAQQRALAGKVSDMSDEGEFVRALYSLGPALQGVLAPPYIDMLEALSNRALLINSEENKALALARLGSGLHQGRRDIEEFDDVRHEQIVTAIFYAVTSMEKEVSKSFVIENLGKGLLGFSHEQRDSLLDISLHMTNEYNRGNATAGWGKALLALTDIQKENLFYSALSLVSDRAKSSAIAGLGATPKAFNAEQQVRLVDAAVNLDEQFKAKALEGLRDVEDIQQYSRLVDAALSLPPSDQESVLAQLIKRESF